jgi:hypothetical protein
VKKLRLEVDKKPFSVEKYYQGVYRRSDKDEYPFTITSIDTDDSLLQIVHWDNFNAPYKGNTLKDLEKTIIEQL